jgi:C1A family cysteine protease
MAAVIAAVCLIQDVAFADETSGDSGESGGKAVYGRGFIPPPFENYHVSVGRAKHASALVLPERFDWREAGYVSPVKNQGSCGACYAFAGAGDFESKLLKAGEGLYDFSENNLKDCQWFARSGYLPACNGGTYWLVVSHMADKGTVLETCDPYRPYATNCKTACSYIKTLLDWRVFTMDEIPSPELMKTYIMEQGPIFVAITTGPRGSPWEDEFNDYDGSYTLHNPTSTVVNHAVLIVGWDDTLTHEGGQGAWICKNSWGTAWGGPCGYGTEGGYFTIAYGSANIGWYSSFIKRWKDFDPCDRLLFHDESGFNGYTGYNVKTGWAMSKFVASEPMTLERVEFWTTDATSEVDIYVYDDFNGTALSNLLVSYEDTSFTEMGYHSVAMPSPVPMSTGQDFYVAVKLKNLTLDNPPIPVDPVQYAPRAPGMCYVSPTGATWSEYTYGDVGVRARMSLTRDCRPPERVSSFSAAAGESDIVLRWTNPADDDFSHTAIRYSTATYPLTIADGTAVNNGMDGLFYNTPASADSFTHRDRSLDVTYYYSAFAADTLDNYSLGVNVSATPGDTTAPDSVSEFAGYPNDRQVKLKWTNPGNSDLAGVLIRYSTEGPPGLEDGAPVENGSYGQFAGAPAAQDSFIHHDRVNGETYYYSIWSFDTSSNYSASRSLDAVPVDLMPPGFSVSIFQNPYISNHLDVYVIASEPVLEESFIVTIEGEDEDHQGVPGNSRAVRCDYDLYESGELNVKACATDLNSNSGCYEKAYAVSMLLAGSGGRAASLDGLMTLEVDGDVLASDTFVLVSKAADNHITAENAFAPAEGSLEAEPRAPVSRACSGTLYKATPGALELTRPATVSIAYGGVDAEPEHLAVARLEGGGVESLESHVDRDSGRIVARTDRLGTFGLLERPDAETPDLPGESLKLMQNVPNPFAGTTRISYSLPRAGNVRIDVLAVDGRLVRTLINEPMSPGIHEIDWDATNASGASVAGGIYFYRIVTPEAAATRKMVFLR